MIILDRGVDNCSVGRDVLFNFLFPTSLEPYKLRAHVALEDLKCKVIKDFWRSIIQ